MVLLWFYMMYGTLLTMPKLSLGISYNLQGDTDKMFACYFSEYETTPMVPPVIKLFLHGDHLNLSCHLFDRYEVDDMKNRRKNLVLYTSAGLAPSIEIFNSSYSKVFFFKMILREDDHTWTIDIPRKDIAHNTDISPTEQWYVKFIMHHGLDMFTTKGTLLDSAREPILQWKFGSRVNISEVIVNVINITISKSPCASDVAVIGLIFNDMTSGIYIGISWSAFMSMDTYWSNFTESICVVLEYDCADLSLLNVILTNTHLIFLTTLGLFISQDLRYGPFHSMKFYKANFCGFEMSDYYRAKIWYNVQCLANQEMYEEDYISVSFNKDKTLSQESTCFFSYAPFKQWNSCLPHRKQADRLISKRVVSFIVDYQQNTGVGVLTQQGGTFVSVNTLVNHKLHRKTKFPEFWFPDRKFQAFGMIFHPNSHFLYVYGNQVWLSQDGGNTFQILIKLQDRIIVKTDTCVYTQSIIFTSDKGTTYYTKAGLFRYAKLQSLRIPIFSMNFDHLGALHIVTMDNQTLGFIKTYGINVNKLLKAHDLAFDAPLAPQFVTEEQIVFFNHVPLGLPPGITPPNFHSMYIGKSFEYKVGGSGTINKVFLPKDHTDFLSSITVDVLLRFPVEKSASSPCILNTLTILEPDPGSTSYKLQLNPSTTHIFQASDIEKTITIPGFSSFLIINVVDGVNALGHATMPSLVPLNTPFQSGLWFMYDFGTTNGKRWKVVSDICRYTIQQLDNLPVHAIKYLDLGSKRTFTYRITPVNVAIRLFHMHLMEVIVGKPNLLDVSTGTTWDDNDSYTLKLHVESKFFEQGKTSVAMILNHASLSCEVTTMILTLKSSCSYLKDMHFILPVQLSASDWILQKENSSKYLRNLPVNYRPPSRLGIAVPLTKNFYNADPEQPKMRDHFQGSKASGIYKQCANKTKRSECGCTEDMKLSFYVAFSDCKEKAIRMKYPIVKLPLSFTVENEDGSVNLSSPYFVIITEVNNRTNWEISGTNATSSMLKMRNYLGHRLKKTLYNPDGLTLSIHGSELFHFRVTTIPGISFCSLFDEFQIYVDDAPLAFPGEYLITSLTAVVVGSAIFMAFILQVYDIQIWSMLKQKLKQMSKVSPKVSLSTISTTSSSESSEK
ncbi:cation channel sperm-associated auxiliary subunit beta-like [Paroedura picta]|uniref:cation channel sperm-associated auxiliary subunit beta-like n=1 Tax=Paroedura picta TaxID=143630 RepID=UPI004055FAAD